MDLLRKTTHTTIGIPNRAVMALRCRKEAISMLPKELFRAEGHDDRYFGKAFL